MSDEIVTLPSPETRAVESAQFQDMADLVAKAEAQSDLITRAVSMSIKATNETDWVNQDGTPYLMASGAEKVAIRFGVEIFNVRHSKQRMDEHPGHYMYVYVGTVRVASSEMEVIGACSSRDKFFGRKGGNFLAAAEVDEPNIVRKAYNNMVNNAIKRRLGLRNLTWDQLKAAGLDIGKIKGFTYKTGEQGGTTEATKTTAEMEQDAKGDATLRDDITRWLSTMHPDDPEACMEHLKAASGFDKDGKHFEQSSPSSLKGNWLKSTHKKLSGEFAAWQKEHKAPAAAAAS
ncbi:MAG: hypothetical protein KGL39_51065 [Patescibacteria group bacterium]|nr:hypothetical protein [Patescibacteria group bacterium]